MPDILERIRRAPEVLLFLDFDGTLTPLRPRPEQVRLAPSARNLLRRLARQPRVALFIISGRTLADLKARVGLPNVRCLGLHGWQGLPGARLDGPSRTALAQLRRAVRREILVIPGLRLENKGEAFSLHFRGARREAIRQARRRLKRLLRPFERQLRVMEGKKIWEVLPRLNRGKGAAVKKLRARFPRGSLTIYMGDDTTDEDAFRALPSGITVRVGSFRRTRARWLARNPSEVIRFLKEMERALG